jgi:hypothetical protein
MVMMWSIRQAQAPMVQNHIVRSARMKITLKTVLALMWAKLVLEKPSGRQKNNDCGKRIINGGIGGHDVREDPALVLMVCGLSWCGSSSGFQPLSGRFLSVVLWTRGRPGPPLRVCPGPERVRSSS